MKKLLIVFALSSLFSVFAQTKNLSPQRDESKWSDVTYVNVPILKVLEGKEAYVIIYQKNKVGVADVVIPKSWTDGSPENPRKLKFRNSKNSITSFMTVIKKGGEFHRVVLTLPMSKQNSIWGLADYHKELEGSDKQTLEELDL